MEHVRRSRQCGRPGRAATQRFIANKTACQTLALATAPRGTEELPRLTDLLAAPVSGG